MKTKDEDFLPYCQHLAALNSDFNQRFEDILHMTIPDWVLDFFSTINTDECPNLQEELIELITYQEIILKFINGYQQFWLQKQIPTLYSNLFAIKEKFLFAFPSSYLVERVLQYRHKSVD